MRVFVALLALFTGTLLAGRLQAQSPFTQPLWGLERVLQFAPQVRSGGSYLGVALTDIDADRANALKLGEERGVEVRSVEQGSPADTAGIKPGDVLLSYNGESILGAQQFVRLVQETPQGRKVKIQCWRDGKVIPVMVTTAAPPDRHFGTASPFGGFSTPDMQYYLSMPDVPSPLLVWKNSILGIEFERVDSQLAEYFGVKGGVLLRSVDKGSPADKGGLKAGDVIFGVRNRMLLGDRDLTSYLRQPGTSIPVNIMRDHKRLDLTITLSNNQQ
jgi:serine protease Do